MEAVKIAPSPEDIQHDMQDTKDHLTQGVQDLGDRAAGYARDAAEAVGDACRGVKESVHAVRDVAEHAVADATAFAGRALDVRRHVHRYPWAALGGAFAAGFICGRFVGRR